MTRTPTFAVNSISFVAWKGIIPQWNDGEKGQAKASSQEK
jgi:hypothetical protein